jgi:hypothetical protein
VIIHYTISAHIDSMVNSLAKFVLMIIHWRYCAGNFALYHVT